MRNLTSAVMPVSTGDWFELAVYVGTAGELRGLERSWLAIEVVETVDAADPPADISGYKAGQSAAGEVILRVPVVRRTRLQVDLAGSQGSAGVAATAQDDVEIQRNGTSIATLRFAAGAPRPPPSSLPARPCWSRVRCRAWSHRRRPMRRSPM